MGDPPHRWRVDFNYLTGITAGRWWELLRREGFAVDATYAHRAALITLMSVVNSGTAALEALIWGRRIRDARAPAPLVLLGHYRQGTTHLHNLLAQDPRFGFPTTYAVANPYTFLTTERVNARLLAPLLPKKRPQDGMALGFGLPQEDEYALALTSLVSPYLGMSFPRSEGRYLPHLTLGESADVERWKEALALFLRKLAVRDPRPQVLKSPTHTARVRRLLEVCPEARFVHIHRDPYVVFASTRHLIRTSVPFLYLQRPDPSVIDERILTWYTAMYDAMFAEKALIPPGRFAEIGFDELESAPIPTLRRVYAELGLPDFETAEPHVRRYLDGVRGYEKNAYPPLTRRERDLVATRWARTFEAWGYPT